ncbi:hypothetical protein ACWGI7_25175, partial [Streptomyces collinus]
MLRGRARRAREAHVATGDDPRDAAGPLGGDETSSEAGRLSNAGQAAAADPLDAAQERRVRAVLALGGVPQADLPDGVQ